MKLAARIFVSVVAVLAGAALVWAAEMPRFADVVLTSPKGEKLHVKAEIADTDGLRQKGLMNRTKMGADEGMVFVWPDNRPVGFWMKDTRLPLDMIFAVDGVVTGIAAGAQPMDETVIPSPGEVDAVLEVNGGWAAAHHVDAGWRLEILKNR